MSLYLSRNYCLSSRNQERFQSGKLRGVKACEDTNFSDVLSHIMYFYIFLYTAKNYIHVWNFKNFEELIMSYPSS